MQPATLQAVAAALGGRVNAVQPQYRGERGHPVGFAAGCGAQLAMLEGSLGASSILRSMRAIDSVADLVVDDVGVVTDIDTPEALAQAEALWLAREGA
ncbi:hypothetical protein [Variovorax sp. Varisp62]|uniref:hypothetical protein n=1 Tax=Variovorax sp. Varisp62 TaxID=3243049 RepID=UPI0039B63A35